MKTLNIKLCLFVAFLCAALTAKAQLGKLYTTDNQLSNSFVTQVFQDRDGFIWMATRNGLNRYDGYQVKIYKKDDGRSQLNSNYINCMFQDSRGNFYVGNNLGVQRYNGESFETISLVANTGRDIQTYIYDIQQYRGQVIIVSSGYGLFRLTGSRRAVAFKNQPTDVIYSRRALEDTRRRLWVITSFGGLYCFDGEKVRGRYFTDKALASSLRDICVDSRGQVWVGTLGHGLWRLNESTGRFERMANAGALPVTKLYVNKAGKIMLGCDGAGLYVYDPQHDLLTPTSFYTRETDLTHAKVYAIVEDQSGNLWLGLPQKGVFMQPAAQGAFGYMGAKLGAANVLGSNSVTSVCVDSAGRLWVGTDKDGLYLLTPDRQLIRHYRSVPSTVLTLCEDRLGRIWIGSYEQGCGWVTADADNYHPVDGPVARESSVFGIVSDSRGMLWIGTLGQGLYRLNPQDLTAVHHEMKPTADVNRKINSIPNNFLGTMTLSPDGNRLYISTAVGVCALDIERGSWLSVFGANSPNYGHFTRVATEAPDGKVYVGTNDGLLIYDRRHRTWRQLTTKDGLPDNGVAAIEADRNGNLWLATDHGLGCMNAKTGKIDCYYTDHGLQSNEFADGASWISPSRDKIILGGTGGISWFDIGQIKPHTWKATVKITGLTVGNQELNVKPDSSFFTMNYEDNSFSIHLSTLTYNAPDNIDYLYSINGDDWVKLTKGSNEIAFSHLSPGTYRFRVKAMSNNVATPERLFTVVVRAPWYRSTPAYAVYLLLLAAAVYLYLQYRKRKEADRLRLQEHIHAEELGEAKLKFFMNISHEIRTPMTLIVSPLRQLMKDDDDPHRRGIYQIINRNAERILSLVNQIMDLRKIDKGQMGLQMQETDLVGFTRDIHSLFQLHAKAKSLRFTFDHDTAYLPVWIDRTNFDKVLMNLLSNAFKFSPAGGSVDIALTHDAQHARLAITNDGAPIPDDKLERIFERFYQMPSHANDRNVGTGIGLDLARSLVELHHGTICAMNLPDGSGCRFEVTLPLGNAHLRPEEMMAADTTAPEPVTATPAGETPEAEPDTGQDAAAMAEPREETPSRKRQHIVIAEDDNEISQYLKAELEKDYRVTLCPDGQEALAAVLREMPALVISDIMMPKMDGNILCSKLKSNINTNHIPVILLTAKNRDEDRLEGLETGADAYIVKPFNMDILRRVIFNLLSQRKTLRIKYNGNETQEDKIDEVRIDSPDERLMERIMTVINKNLSNSDLSVDMIAQEVGISRVHLFRKMKELTNQAPHAFIRNTRLKQAAKLLATSNRNITEVMYACGFQNATSFSTIFKKFYGVSPREYMKQNNEG